MSRRCLSVFALLPLLSGACDSGEKPKAVPVGPVTVHHAPTTAPREEEVAALKDFVSGGSKPVATAPSSPGELSDAGRPAASPDRPMPRAGIPVPNAPSQDLKYDVPADWIPEKPTSMVRKAQWALPRAEADAENGLVVLFYFGKGQGGGIAGNIARWKGMFSTEDGKPLPDDAIKEERFTANGLNVTLVDMTGRYAESMMPGQPPSAVKSGHRMIGAIVETADGSFFFKCTAPAPTMAKHEAGVRSLLKSVRQ